MASAFGTHHRNQTQRPLTIAVVLIPQLSRPTRLGKSVFQLGNNKSAAGEKKVFYHKNKELHGTCALWTKSYEVYEA
jgi:ABC-type glucose/galactose transport system permease subunit